MINLKYVWWLLSLKFLVKNDTFEIRFGFFSYTIFKGTLDGILFDFLLSN